MNLINSDSYKINLENYTGETLYPSIMVRGILDVSLMVYEESFSLISNILLQLQNQDQLILQMINDNSLGNSQDLSDLTEQREWDFFRCRTFRKFHFTNKRFYFCIRIVCFFSTRRTNKHKFDNNTNPRRHYNFTIFTNPINYRYSKSIWISFTTHCRVTQSYRKP